MLSITFGPAVLASFLLIVPRPAHAGPVQSDDTVTTREALTVSLVTVGPGARIWERFGHNAIWIHDSVTGTSHVFDYGRFSFEQKGFILRLIRGDMLYSMGSDPFEPFVRSHIAVNRTVWIQELNLTREQRQELRDFLQWNMLEENRRYPYDYYIDNCSTRIRDVLDRVLDNRIREQLDAKSGTGTYRYHTRRSSTNNVFYYTGLLIALGPRVDRPINAWDEAFLPTELRKHLASVVIERGGERVPLVRTERLVHQGAKVPENLPNWLIVYLFGGVLLASGMLWLAERPVDDRVARLVFAGAAATWGLVTGVVGVGLIGLWTLTNHEAAYWNQNVLLLNPLALPLACTIPFAVHSHRIREWAVRLAFAVAALSFLGWIAKVLPGVDQVNGELIAVALPVNCALAVALRRCRTFPIVMPSSTARSSSDPAGNRGVGPAR